MLDIDTTNHISLTDRLQAAWRGTLWAGLIVMGSGHAALAAPAAEEVADPSAATHDRCDAAPAFGFLVQSGGLHVSYAIDALDVGEDRFSLEPEAAPPEDAFVPFEGHPRWGRVALAAIVAAPEDQPEYLPVRDGRLPVAALRDYFVIYLEKAAPAGSEFADYLFHSQRGVSAGYHLVHSEVELGTDPVSYRFTVVSIDQPIPNAFESGVTPTGLNL